MLIILLAQAAQPDPVHPLDNLRPTLAPPVAKRPSRETAQIEAIGNQRPIAGIVFDGAKAPPEVAAAARPFLGRPNNERTLAELAAALSDAYAKSRVALYTVAIPRQDFAEDVVTVILAEASVSDVEVSGKGRFRRVSAIAGKLVGETPLSRALYERQLSLIQAIPGLTATIDVRNPDHDEDVTLALGAKQKRAEVAFGVSNRGPDLIGDLLLDARADFYQLATEGDRLRLTASVNPHPNRFMQLGTSYDLPIGNDGLTLSASAALLRTRARDIDLRGRAKLASLALSYPLIRDFHRAADVSFSLDGVNSDNAAFGNIISTDRTRAARLAGGYAAVTPKSKIQASAVISKGLGFLGARVNPILSEESFFKVAASLAYDREVTRRIVGRTTIIGQYSDNRLPGTELYSVGGPVIGRAFDTGFLSGDKGIGGVAEVAWRPIARGRFDKSELYLFADGALLAVHERGFFPGQHYDLASAGLGARMKWNDKIQLGLEGARVLDRPYPTYPGDWRLSFGYRLTL